MPIEDPKTPLTPTATPDTLSEFASRADLGPLDPNQALKIKLCEARVENKYLPIVGDLQTKVATLKAQYISVLRELRDKIQAIRLEDILKVVVGVLVTILSHDFSQKGMKALTEFWTLIELFLFVICFGFLAFRLIYPVKRKREIEKELELMETEGKQ